MDPFHIVIDLGSLELSQGAITGRIHVSNARNAFPEPEWNDFVVVVLRWWLEAAAKIFDGIEREGVFQFMDGSFSIALRSRPDSSLVLTTREGPRRRVVETWTCRSEEVRDELIRSASSVLAACRAKNWTTDDVESLASELAVMTRTTAGRGGRSQ